MGYGLQRGGGGRGTTCLQPSSLTGAWELKLGPPLCTLGTQPKGHLASIFACVLDWGIPWCNTGGGVNYCPPCQVAVLLGYNKKHVYRSMHSAIQRVYGDTVHNSDMAVANVHNTA